jgi:hypothetical protein
MIDPRIAIEDVDPDGFARVNAALSQRERSARTTLSVLHEDGRVLHATATGVDDAAIRDPEALRVEHGVDEVVLLDRRGLDDLCACLVELARSTDDQGVLLAACRDAYLDHWAVTVVPRPAPSRWPEVQRLVNRVGDGEWLVAECGDFTLAGEVRGGRIVRITSVVPAGAKVAALVQCGVDQLDAVLLAADPLAALAEGGGRVELGEGVEWPG